MARKRLACHIRELKSMKTLENRETALDKDKDEKMTYFDLFKVVLENKGQDGFTIQEMRKRLRVMEILEKGTENAEMEDDDFETLKACWDAMKWGIVSKDVSNADSYLKEIK